MARIRIWRFLIDTVKDGYAVEKGRKRGIHIIQREEIMGKLTMLILHRDPPD